MQKFSAVIVANIGGQVLGLLDPRLLDYALVESCGSRGHDGRFALEFYDLIVALVITSIADGNPYAKELAEWTMRSCGVSIFMGTLSSEARYEHEQRERVMQHEEMVRSMSIGINDLDPDLLRLLTRETAGDP